MMGLTAGWRRVGVVLLVAAAGIWSARMAHPGECVDATNPRAIVSVLSGANPNALSAEARYLLCCLSHGVGLLCGRPPRELPSWRLLRNTRREFRDLGRYPELLPAVESLRASSEGDVRVCATVAVALYGTAVSGDTLSALMSDLPWKAMVLAVLGDTLGVQVATQGYGRVTDEYTRLALLDALYYQCTPTALAFLSLVAQGSPGAATDRARWMIQHPFSREASWKL
jgi:hypothetical protein